MSVAQNIELFTHALSIKRAKLLDNLVKYRTPGNTTFKVWVLLLISTYSVRIKQFDLYEQIFNE